VPLPASRGRAVSAGSELQAVRDYHQRTKHRFDAYAAGPDTLDWDDQPEPFRWYEGAAKVDLPLLADRLTVPFVDLYEPRRRQSHWTRADLPDFERLAIMLERSLGLAAWKSYGTSRWALRCNPSSGNLHPTEAYVVTPGVEGLAAGVYHYLSRDHQLEHRCRLDPQAVADALPQGAFLVGLSSVHWREAWKYGERAYRYCQHDCGHAIAALAYAAAAVGWSVRLLDEWGDDEIARVLGLDRASDFEGAEREHPDVMLLVEEAQSPVARPEAPALATLISGGDWAGGANRLSSRHFYDWPVIDEVAAACHKPHTAVSGSAVPARAEPLPNTCDDAAMALIRRRRSAQGFDGCTSITAAQLFRMLDMTLPRAGVVPWDSLSWRPRVHLALFVHRVEGLKPGVYVFARDTQAQELLRASMQRPQFDWQKPDACPDHLELYGLVFANCQRAAATLSCHQAIAGDSAFSLGMLAEFDTSLADAPWRYRQLYWEAGMLGQVLYLEAEAAGVRGTGIGCFFDDPVHNTLGMDDSRLQSLYHFTVGGPLTDERLVTSPPYPHLSRQAQGA
jgi:SagB-type dehydrogenase family enzyme